MQCVTPMIRRYKQSNYKDGKIVPRSEVMDGLLNHDTNHIRRYIKDVNRYNRIHDLDDMYEIIPCNHCYACNLNYSAEWATRCMLEMADRPAGTCFWMTLTYDEEHLPLYEQFQCITKNTYVDGHIESDTENFYNDGTWTGSLEPDHVTQFIDTIRHYYRKKENGGIQDIKYFYCGEYGTQNHRPHYHLILFGAPLDTNDFYGTHVDGKFFKEHWKSKQIDKWWKYGLHEVCVLEWSNAAYTTRYCMKKLCEEPKSERIYASMGKIPEFVRMSKGIGFKYYYDHIDEIYKTDSIAMKTVKGNTGAIKPPKAFDRKLEKEHPEEYERIKKERKKIAERAYNNELRINTSSDLQKLKLKAEKVLTKAAQLPREGDFG